MKVLPLVMLYTDLTPVEEDQIYTAAVRFILKAELPSMRNPPEFITIWLEAARNNSVYTQQHTRHLLTTVWPPRAFLSLLCSPRVQRIHKSLGIALPWPDVLQ